MTEIDPETSYTLFEIGDKPYGRQAARVVWSSKRNLDFKFEYLRIKY